MEAEWRHLPLKGKTDYTIVAIDGGVALRAEGRNSASGLIRRVDIDPHACPIIEWRWRVDRIQPSANLYTKDGDDVGAALFLMFGDPGSMFLPKSVPTVRYVWTTDHATRGAVFDNPYLPGLVKNIIVENRKTHLGQWITASRNLYEDFTKAFPNLEATHVKAFALMTDNDQTSEPVTALYGRVQVRCKMDKALPFPKIQ